MRGTTLRVDDRGRPDAPPILFVHGGPGQGCHDFMGCQGDLLAADLRLVGVDQRGALYSDLLPDDATLRIDDLVADFEAVRIALGIDRWVVLGHSIGGRYALRYALLHPDTVTAVVFENPEWDFAGSTRAQLDRALPLLRELGAEGAADAERVGQLLGGDIPATSAMWREKRRLVAGLPALYLHDTSRGDVVDLFPAPLAPSVRARGQRHGELLAEDPMFYRPLLLNLAELTQPALLLVGADDPIATDAVLGAFRTSVTRGHVELFDRSGHFVHVEEPRRYAVAVRDFVLATTS